MLKASPYSATKHLVSELIIYLSTCTRTSPFNHANLVPGPWHLVGTAAGMMKSNHKITLFTSQVHAQSLVHGWVGDQAGDRGEWAVGQAKVAHSGHCSIGVMEFFLIAVIAGRDPEDVSRWLSCRCLTHSHPAFVLSQSHRRRDCRRNFKKPQLLFLLIFYNSISFLV